MAFNPLQSAKDSALTGIQRGVNQTLGTSGSFLGNAIFDLLGGISQSLFEVGQAFNTISSVTSLKLDSVIAGGDTNFVTGKCPERASAGDIAANRGGVTQSTKDHIIKTDPSTVIDGKRTKHNMSSLYPLAIASGKYYMSLRFYEYNRKDLFRSSENKHLYTVTLPLPTELSDSQRTEYQNADMKVVGTLMTEGFTGGAGGQAAMTGGTSFVMNVAGQLASGALGAIPDNTIGSIIKGMAGAAANAGEKMGFNEETLVNAIEQYTGMAPNPQPSVLFKGPNLREFSFQWTFNPRNEDESTRIRETIEKMKASALPRKEFGNSTGVLTYPHVCMINFYPWDGSKNRNNIYQWGENSIIRIKRCFISNITSNYAPNGVPTFFANGAKESGAPTFIQLSITLKEIEFFTAEDWESYKGTPVAGQSFDIGIGNNINDDTAVKAGVAAAASFAATALGPLGGGAAAAALITQAIKQ